MATAGNDGASKAGYSGSLNGGHNRPQGRGRSESHGEERSVRARSSRDQYRDVDRDQYRYWLHARNKPPRDHEGFVIVSYNILADVNVRKHQKELYWHIPHFILDWDARKRKLLRELGLWSPDIVCLQEVDHYEDFNEELQKEGYVGVYTVSSGAQEFMRSLMNPAEVSVYVALPRDGFLTTLIRGIRFELLEEESIKFQDHNLWDNVAQLCVFQTKSKNLERSDSKETDDTKPTTSGSCDSKYNRVVVGNTHVLFNPKRGDVKLGQARVLLEKAHAISEKWGNAPVAIAGDFNSTPGSALYRFISSSELDLASHDRRNISGQDECTNKRFRTDGHLNGESKHERLCMTSGSSGGVEAAGEEESVLDSENSIVSVKSIDSKESIMVTIGEATLATQVTHQKVTKVNQARVTMPIRIRGWDQFELMTATGGRHLSVVQHKLNLRSAYSEIEGKPGSRDDRGEPFVTTSHIKFTGTVDYIWHTDDLVTVKVLDTLPNSVLERCSMSSTRKFAGLPSKKWGSDHLALACEFSFASRKDRNRSKQKVVEESG